MLKNVKNFLTFLTLLKAVGPVAAVGQGDPSTREQRKIGLFLRDRRMERVVGAASHSKI